MLRKGRDPAPKKREIVETHTHTQDPRLKTYPKQASKQVNKQILQLVDKLRWKFFGEYKHQKF